MDDGAIYTIAGGAETRDDGVGTDAGFFKPADVAASPNGELLFIAEYFKVRQLNVCSYHPTDHHAEINLGWKRYTSTSLLFW